MAADMGNVFTKFTARVRALRDIEAMTDRDIADIGMTRDRLSRFATMPADTSERVEAMAGVFGLSAGEEHRHHGEWLELVETCGTCTDRAACARLLERGTVASPRDAGFCPNAHTFASHWDGV
jgi:hypothetical protein